MSPSVSSPVRLQAPVNAKAGRAMGPSSSAYSSLFTSGMIMISASVQDYPSPSSPTPSAATFSSRRNRPCLSRTTTAPSPTALTASTASAPEAGSASKTPLHVRRASRRRAVGKMAPPAIDLGALPPLPYTLGPQSAKLPEKVRRGRRASLAWMHSGVFSTSRSALSQKLLLDGRTVPFSPTLSISLPSSTRSQLPTSRNRNSVHRLQPQSELNTDSEDDDVKEATASLGRSRGRALTRLTIDGLDVALVLGGEKSWPFDHELEEFPFTTASSW